MFEPTTVWAVCEPVLVQPFRGRLARHEVSLPKPSASAGAHEGTLRPITSPFLTGIVASSGNWAVMPKYGSSLTAGLDAISLYVRFGFFCGRRIAMPASATPPSLASKNLICVAVGFPSEIVQATIVPSRRTLSGLWEAPTLAWKPVVRLTARQGVAGQLGVVTGLVAPIRPTSLSVAGGGAGTARARARGAE